MKARETISGVNLGFGTENPNCDTAIEHAFEVAETAQAPISRSGTSIVVCAATEIPVGGKKIVEIDELTVGIFNIAGVFHAIKNVCPHAGAPLCEGHIQTTHRPGEVGKFEPALEGRVLRCPWHGWEFDIVTGKGLFDRTSRVATYATEVDAEGNVLVLL